MRKPDVSTAEDRPATEREEVRSLLSFAKRRLLQSAAARATASGPQSQDVMIDTALALCLGMIADDQHPGHLSVASDNTDGATHAVPAASASHTAMRSGKQSKEQAEFDAQTEVLIKAMEAELAVAIARRDPKAIRYCREALDEMMRGEVSDETTDLGEWYEKISKTSKGQAAIEKHESEKREFLAIYRNLKARAGLSTLRQVARRAGLSLGTVQGIESGRLMPQFRTLEKLAVAFGVSVSVLCGDPEPQPKAVSATPRGKKADKGSRRKAA